jgi:hypothetical protein
MSTIVDRTCYFFIAVNAVRVSGGFSAHHQELKTVHTAHLLAATASVGEFKLTHANVSSKQA